MANEHGTAQQAANGLAYGDDPEREREAPKPRARQAEVPFERIASAVKSVRYGTVQLIIQDGRVIQIDKTEKIRLV